MEFLLGASFVVVLLLTLLGRAQQTPDDQYLSSTFPHALPYPALVMAAAVAALLFGIALHRRCPTHPRAFHWCAAVVSLLLGLTIVITLPISRPAHYAVALLSHVALLLLLVWDAHIRQASPHAQAVLAFLWLLLVLQLVCWWHQTSAGPAVQGTLVLGIWAYMLVIFVPTTRAP